MQAACCRLQAELHLWAHIGNTFRGDLWYFHYCMCLFALKRQRLVRKNFVTGDDGDFDLNSHHPIFCFISFTLCRWSWSGLLIVWTDNYFIMRKRSTNVVRWQMDVDEKTRNITLLSLSFSSFTFPWREMSSCLWALLPHVCGALYRIRTQWSDHRETRERKKRKWETQIYFV